AGRTRGVPPAATVATRHTSAMVCAPLRGKGRMDPKSRRSGRLVERRLRALRARRQHGGARGVDGPAAPGTGERAGGGDVAGPERHGRMVALQQVAAQVLAQALRILDGELARRDQRVARRVERAVERGGGGLAGPAKSLLEGIEHPVEELLLLLAHRFAGLLQASKGGILQRARPRPRALAPEVRADGTA